MRLPRFRSVLAAALASAALLAPARGEETIPVIAHGNQVRLESHLVPGKLVLFDFYADWCGPCRSLAPTIDQYARSNPGRLAVRKVDIVNWGSDVARQHDIRFVPQLKLFGPDGRLVAAGQAGAVLGTLERLLADPSAAGGLPSLSTGGGATPTRSSPIGAAIVVLAVLLAAASLLIFGSRRNPAPVGVSEGGAFLPPTPTPPPLPGAADRSWFVRVDLLIDGPYTAAEVEALRRDGHIPPDALARRRGESDWKPVGEIPKAG